LFVCFFLETSEENEYFTLRLRHDGRINHGPKSQYVGGGAAECWDYMSINEWGMITLREKVEELGYDLLETKLFSKSISGL